MLTIDDAKNAKAIERFKSLTALDDTGAGLLVEAVLQAAADQALETITGEGPVPSALSAVRAEQLHSVCLRFGRTLSKNEVGVLFRIPPSAAQSIIVAMNATYAESLHSQLIDVMKSRARVSPSGTTDKGLNWTVKFNDSMAYGIALNELERMRLIDDVETDDERFTIEFGQDTTIVDRLGLTRPRPSSRRR